jgi:AraC-like DNA-binding protein
MSTIASTVFDTDRVAPHARFALWRETISSTHDTVLPDDSDPAKFSVFARGWNLGTSLVIETRMTTQIMSRAQPAIRADQLDHYIFHVQRQGSWIGEAGDSAAETGVGNVMVLDMARPTRALGTGSDSINIIVPRDVLDALLPAFDMHGLLLRGAASELLRSYLVSLVDNLPQIPSEYVPAVANASCGLLAACLAPSRATAEQARAPLAVARLAEIRRYIDRHLGSRDLTPEAIGRALGLSRSTLYATCDSHGGIAAMIQQRRLQRVRAILADPHDRRRISDIAFQHGFVSTTHFSRAFRTAFGCTPSEAREGVRPPDGGDAMGAGYALEMWLRQLGG